MRVNTEMNTGNSDKRKNYKLREYVRKLEFNNHILQAQQEVSLDGILVVDENWKMVSFNQRFIDMWEIPDYIIECKDDKKSIKTVLDKLKNPEKFLAQVKALMENPDAVSRDELALKDGRFFDRYSAPIVDPKNNLRGRVWFFRDVSAIKQAEALLQKQKDELEAKVYARTRQLERINARLQARENELSAKNLSLRTLLHAMEEEKKLLKKKTAINFRQALLPLFEQLREMSLPDRQRHIVETIAVVLEDLTASMNYSLLNSGKPLSPTELKIANCIKAGKSSKEIAALLGCSARTVEGHRLSIRAKLGLKRGDNLLSFLLSLT